MRKTQFKKKLAKQLEKISHDFIRRRDSFNHDPNIIGGNCFDCDVQAFGQQFQCGHFIPDSVGGALLRYHPWNMHGQAGGCNMKYQQETVKINYTLKMLEKYGLTCVNRLKTLRLKSIKADSIFYTKMIELYTIGNEQNIVDYLDSLVL